MKISVRLSFLLLFLQTGSGLRVEMKVRISVPEYKGIERVQVVQPMRVKAETASLSLCSAKRVKSSPQFMALGGRSFSVRLSDPSILWSGSIAVGSDGGPDTLAKEIVFLVLGGTDILSGNGGKGCDWKGRGRVVKESPGLRVLTRVKVEVGARERERAAEAMDSARDNREEDRERSKNSEV